MTSRSLVAATLLGLAACGRASSVSPMVSAGAPFGSHAAPFDAWTLPDAIRLGPSSPAESGAAKIALAAARNETVSFQISVRAPAGGLTGLTLEAQPKNDGVSSVLYREYFVKVPHASPVSGRPHSLGAGIYPDGLIPFVDPQTGKPLHGRLTAGPISLPAGQVQPYWIDVAVASTAKPGDYTATYVVRSDQGTATISIPLHVWRFTMPVAPSVDSSFGMYTKPGFDIYGISTAAELLAERVQPNPVATPSETRLKPLGLKMVQLGIWSGAYYGHCQMAAPPTERDVAKLAARNAIRYAIDQPADEIGACPNLHSTLVPIIQRYARALHAAGVLDLITMAPIPALESDGGTTGQPAVDIWTMLPHEYDGSTAEVRRVLAKGQRAWFYTALAQDSYAPKWEIDVPPADYRVPALIDAHLGLTGELYWAVNYWTKSPWEDVEYDAGGGQYYAGEGILTYPGADVGIAGLAPSMRLKWIRDGMYDADEVALLARCGRGAWALAQSSRVARNWHVWSEDAGALDAVHRTLAAELDAHCSN